MTDRSEGLSALADPTRRELLDLLSQQGELSASALTTTFPISRQAILKHLQQLEDAGLVSRRRDGRSVLFSINRPELQATSDWLAATTNRWDQRLNRLETHLNRKPPPTEPRSGVPQ